MKETFLNLYEQNVDEVFKYCYQKTSDRELAKCITEESFMKVWDDVASGDSPDESTTKLYTVASTLIKSASSVKPLREPRFMPALKLS